MTDPSPDSRPYCLLHADGRTLRARGEVRRLALLADLPRPGPHPVIAMVPYSQVRERGYAAHDEGEPILALVPSAYEEVALDALEPSEDARPRVASEPVFEPSDEEFEGIVRAVVDNEIRRGEGSNFLISRSARLTLESFGAPAANEIFRRLVLAEPGAYMTFCFFDGERWLIGASPERHITVRGGAVTMNPICGTLPKAELRDRERLLRFLADRKEVNELFQVVDEELKAMARICRAGGSVVGPFLKEMGTVVHTEYVLEGRSSMRPLDAFRESMFAATMMGSPLENAARVVQRYERDSRRYYSAALLVLDEEDGVEHLDSAITIRTVEVDAGGRAEIRAGASIVRDSDPRDERRETSAKADAVLSAIASPEPRRLLLPEYVDDEVEAALRVRNEGLSDFWTLHQEQRAPDPALAGRTVLIIDNEDQFTYMLRHMLDSLGMETQVQDYRHVDPDWSAADVVLVGPGPGDPMNMSSSKISRGHALVQQLLDERAPFAAVCLGHQILCARLGIAPVALDPPLQGVQCPIDLFGAREAVGFYNTFVPQLDGDPPAGVELALDGRGVMATRGERFFSFQFHVESVLTSNGTAILRDEMARLLG